MIAAYSAYTRLHFKGATALGEKHISVRIGASVADPDPGSGAFLTPGPGIWIRDPEQGLFRISELGSQTHIF